MNFIKAFLKDLVYQVNGAAIEVDKSIGPGLLEGRHHLCLKKELELREINLLSELTVPLKYNGFEL